MARENGLYKLIKENENSLKDYETEDVFREGFSEKGSNKNLDFIDVDEGLDLVNNDEKEGNKDAIYFESQTSPLKNILTNSDVVNTLTNGCCLKCGSLDQIDALRYNASAKKSTSSWSEMIFADSSRNALYSKDLKNLIFLSTSSCLISNSCSESPDLSKHSTLCLFSSDLINSGAKKSDLIEKNIYEATEYGFINEKNILLSNTTFILYHLDNLSNLLLSSGGSSESSSLNLPFFAFLPRATDHLISSCSSLEFNFSNSSLPSFSLLINSSLLTSDQFTQDNCFASDLILSGIANVTDAIYISPLSTNCSNFFNCSTFLIIAFLTTDATLTSGNSFLNLANSSSGIETVILGILIPPSSIYVDESNYVYKDFDFLDIDDDSKLVNDVENKEKTLEYLKEKDLISNILNEKRYTIIYNPNKLDNSSVLNILTEDCCLNASSSDQIGELNANASAKYGVSFLCLSYGDISSASGITSLYTSSGKDSIFISNKENRNANASSFILPNFFIFSDSLANSSKTYLGDINLHPELDNFSMIVLLTESFLKKENSIEASTTNILGGLFDICNYKPCLLATLSLSSEPHFKANSSVILESFNSSLATLNINLSDNFSFIALESTELISSLLSSLKPNFNSSGISTFNSAINNDDKNAYLNILVEENKCYKYEWKYFSNLDKKDEVMTLNQSCLGDARTFNSENGVERGEAPSCKEWQKPNEYYEYDFDKEMFRIESEEGELVVSPKHKVYISNPNKISRASDGVTTLSGKDSFNILSPESILQLSLGESAIYGESLEFIDIASGNLSKNSEDGIKSILCFTNENASESSSFDNLDCESILSNLLPISLNKNSGAINSNALKILFSSNTKEGLPFLSKVENTTLASTTNNIYFTFDSFKYLLDKDMLTSSANLLACSSLNLDLFTIFLNLTSSSNSSFKILDTKICQFIFGTELNSSSSDGISTFISDINNEDRYSYLNISYLVQGLIIRIIKNYRGSKLSSSRKLRRVYPYHSCFCFGVDESKLIESLFISTLNTVFYWREKEVDIVRNRLPVEVKNRDNIKRDDLKNIIYYMDKFKQIKGIVITKDEKKLIRINNKSIRLIPAWEFALNSDVN